MADERPIIVKKIKKVAGGHHGGAWKVAYADFVTAMMAFFLLLWLLNAVTEEQKKGIANYFRPTLAVQNASATFTILPGQGQPIENVSGGPSAQQDDEDADASNMGQPNPTEGGGDKPEAGQGEKPQPGDGEKPVDLVEAEKTVQAEEEKRLEEIKSDLKKAIEEDAGLKELENNIKIDQTEDGIRIQLLDQEKISMFPSGSSSMNPRSQELLSKVAMAIKDLPNKLEISGHTDATPYAGTNNYSNWELSTDRANASRRVLVGAGIPVDRLKLVQGRADTDPFIQTDPFDPQNRRISIVLLREPKPAPAPAPVEEPRLESPPPTAPVPDAGSGEHEELIPSN